MDDRAWFERRLRLDRQHRFIEPLVAILLLDVALALLAGSLASIRTRPFTSPLDAFASFAAVSLVAMPFLLPLSVIVVVAVIWIVRTRPVEGGRIAFSAIWRTAALGLPLWAIYCLAFLFYGPGGATIQGLPSGGPLRPIGETLGSPIFGLVVGMVTAFGSYHVGCAALYRHLARHGSMHLSCPKCGYDLEGLRDDQCPECGRDLTW